MQQWVWRLQSPSFLVDLLFMYEFSQIVTYTSKQCQDSHHLPPTRKREVQQLIERMKAARDSFGANETPAVVVLSSYERDVCLNISTLSLYLHEISLLTLCHQMVAKHR